MSSFLNVNVDNVNKLSQWSIDIIDTFLLTRKVGLLPPWRAASSSLRSISSARCCWRRTLSRFLTPRDSFSWRRRSAASSCCCRRSSFKWMICKYWIVFCLLYYLLEMALNLSPLHCCHSRMNTIPSWCCFIICCPTKLYEVTYASVRLLFLRSFTLITLHYFMICSFVLLWHFAQLIVQQSTITSEQLLSLLLEMGLLTIQRLFETK